MSDRDFEARAFRRRFATGMLSFFLGFIALLIAAISLLVIYVRPERGWLETIVFLLQLLPLIFAGACGVACAAMYLSDLPTVLRGELRCYRCGRATAVLRRECQCTREARPVRPKRHWVHYSRRIKPVLMTHLLILAVVFIFVGLQAGPRHYPLALHVMIGHAVLAALLGTLVHLACAILELSGHGRRFRLRAEVFVRVLAVWPFSVAMLMVVLTATGVV